LKKKKFAKNRKKQGNFQVLWGGMMSCVGDATSRKKKKKSVKEKYWLGKKKYEKCNKFYYYDVSTSLVCIKNPLFFLPGEHVKGEQRKHCRVNCLIKGGKREI
jgi:hypothetical protein